MFLSFLELNYFLISLNWLSISDQMSLGRQEAFEVFKRDYKDNGLIDENKKGLKLRLVWFFFMITGNFIMVARLGLLSLENDEAWKLESYFISDTYSKHSDWNYNFKKIWNISRRGGEGRSIL